MNQYKVMPLPVSKPTDPVEVFVGNQSYILDRANGLTQEVDGKQVYLGKTTTPPSLRLPGEK